MLTYQCRKINSQVIFIQEKHNLNYITCKHRNKKAIKSSEGQYIMLSSINPPQNINKIDRIYH
uniref:Uncharacterized protein n=1 Tax=Rhizophora mucronata TaxID=61149 RepID=A0A2P2P7Z5_RHIMU